AAIIRHERKAGIDGQIVAAVTRRQVAKADHPVATIATVDRGNQLCITHFESLLNAKVDRPVRRVEGGLARTVDGEGPWRSHVSHMIATGHRSEEVRRIDCI